MELHYDCILCNINQVYKIITLAGAEDIIAKQIIRRVLKGLSDVDYSKSNSEIMSETWTTVTAILGLDNPYCKIKEACNTLVLKALPEIKKSIDSDCVPLNRALKLAIAGNIIDFVSMKEQSIGAVVDTILELSQKSIEIDDSVKLFEDLHRAKMLFYIGDNCGEIALDKMLIRVIRNEYTNIEHVYYGVRGNPIINDVTLEDAKMVNMEELACVVENGSNLLGTVMPMVSSEFKKKFMEADVIISKGQGNFESLYKSTEKKIFHLFMAKCSRIATLLDVPINSIICLKE